MNVRPDAQADPLVAAVARLDGAMGRVEQVARRMRQRVARAEAEAEQSRDADGDRARLAEELDIARGREAALQDAVQAASDALDGAIEELRDLAREEE